MPRVESEVFTVQGQKRLRCILPEHGAYVIGRDPDCQIVIDDPEVSRHHARVTSSPEQLVLEDLGSTGGTFLNGQRITEPVVLQPSQPIQVGSTILEVVGVASAVPSRQPSASLEDSLRSRTYELGQEVAHGGMGAILSARDTNIHRTVAMKVMRGNQDFDEDRKQRFVQEAQLTGQLEHPNIVPVHELGVDQDGKIFYTMKFVKGVTLHAVLSNIRENVPEMVARFPLGQLLTIFQKACDAIAFAHSKGVVHRDLKPENIMIGEYGEVLVMDWGLAKVLRIEDRGSKIAEGGRPSPTGDEEAMLLVKQLSVISDQSGGMTMDGQVMGTPQFMAPEQAEGKVEEIDARTDIFSLGAILYNILTLHPAVSGETVQEILQKIRAGEIAHPSAYNPKGRSGILPDKPAKRDRRDARPTMPRPPLFPLRHCPGGRVPESLSAVTMKALALKKEDRYQTVKELQNDIEAYQGGFATAAERAGTLRLAWLLIQRHKVESAALAVILALVVGFGTNAIVMGRRATATLAELRNTAPSFAAQAQALIKEQRFDEALQKISYAVSLAPDDAGYRALQGHILQSLLRLKEASDAYAQAVRLRNDTPWAEDNLRLCQKILQQNEGRSELWPQSLAELQEAMRGQGRLDEALAMTRRLGKDTPALYETWKAILEKSELVPKEEVARRLTVDKNGMLMLTLQSINPDSLTAIQGMPLSTLNLMGAVDRPCHLNDLSPLKGMPLRYLVIGNAPELEDLRPLQGMPLEELYLTSNRIVDLSPLKGMSSLKRLAVQFTSVTDLNPLAGLPLQSLDLQGSPVTDLTPLRGIPLHYLCLTGTRVTDLGPLKGLPLTTLVLANTSVTDLSALDGMPLRELWLYGCDALRSVRPLVHCVELELLTVPSQCHDIELLRRLPKLQRIGYEWPGTWDKVPTAAEFWKEYDAKKRKEEGK